MKLVQKKKAVVPRSQQPKQLCHRVHEMQSHSHTSAVGRPKRTRSTDQILVSRPRNISPVSNGQKNRGSAQMQKCKMPKTQDNRLDVVYLPALLASYHYDSQSSMISRPLRWMSRTKIEFTYLRSCQSGLFQVPKSALHENSGRSETRRRLAAEGPYASCSPNGSSFIRRWASSHRDGEWPAENETLSS